MSMGDKIKHAGEEQSARSRRSPERSPATRTSRHVAEAEQAKANVKQAGDSVKDAAEDVLGN